MSKTYIAAILGGSGSVGQYVLKSLLGDTNCKSVVLVSRRPLDELKKLDEDRIKVEMCDPLDDVAKVNLEGVNVAFCTLGHGSSKKATRDDLLRVDATIPGEFAKACKAAGVTHYCLMTAVGADESAKWSSFTKTAAGGSYYNHVKGLAERLTTEVSLPYLLIAQPGILIGSPHTPTLLNYFPNTFIPTKYSSAHVSDIASGMVNSTINAFQNDKKGLFTVTGGIPIKKGI